MIFTELNDLIPWVTGNTNHVVTMSPYNAITLAMPGRHQGDTDPVGGDFVVMVSDDQLGWINHQFTHDDLFIDIERKARSHQRMGLALMDAYAKVVVKGVDPDDFEFKRTVKWQGTLHPQTFLYAVQALAIAEHRRYFQHEKRGVEGTSRPDLRLVSWREYGLRRMPKRSNVEADSALTN
jgi:hypothetical protein